MTFHIILSGIPGSGKSTKAKELKAYFEENGKKVAIYSRDAFRKAWLLDVYGEDIDLEEAYQESFMNPNENIHIKEEFYRKLIDGLELQDDVHIYDMTNISREDAYFWFEFATYAKAKEDTFRFYAMEGKHKSAHNVPDEIMEKYKREQELNNNLWFYLQEYCEDF